MSLLDRIKQNSLIKESCVLSKSKFFNDRDNIPVTIPALNIAFSASLDEGFSSGVTMWAGVSKSFKTGFSLIMAKAYMDKYPESIVLFYDSEFGSPQNYFETFGIDLSRVLHCPITDVEQLKNDIVGQLDKLTREDKVIIIIDSIGNLASKKEVQDALDNKSTADMTRAKQLKSLFRMITPHLVIKDIPLVVVNHTYKEIALYPKDIVGGGCVVPETNVMMSDDTLKPIENILVGDSVKTLYGDKKVTHVWNPDTLVDGEPECYEIEFDDGYKFICSEDHLLMVGDEWIEAKNLEIGMESVVY